MYPDLLIYNLFQSSLLQNQQPSSSEIRTQHEKLEKLETECFNLSRTQALAEVIQPVVVRMNTENRSIASFRCLSDKTGHLRREAAEGRT